MRSLRELAGRWKEPTVLGEGSGRVKKQPPTSGPQTTNWEAELPHCDAAPVIWGCVVSGCTCGLGVYLKSKGHAAGN